MKCPLLQDGLECEDASESACYLETTGQWTGLVCRRTGARFVLQTREAWEQTLARLAYLDALTTEYAALAAKQRRVLVDTPAQYDVVGPKP